MDNQNQQSAPTGEPINSPPSTSVEPAPAPTPAPYTPPASQEPGKSRNTNAIIAVLVALLLIALGALAYLLMNAPTVSAPTSTNSDSTQQETEKEAEVKPTRFTSKLWPDFAIDVPAGWTASEPADYNPSNPDGAKFADGTITVSDGDTTLTFTLGTVRVTGIVGTACDTKQNLVNITDDIYRFTEDDTLIIQPGYTPSSSEWEEIIAYESTVYENGNNYCQKGWPVVGTYTSTIKQSDSPDYPYGYGNNTYVMVFSRAKAGGDLSDSKLSEIDAVIKSLSDSAEIVPYS